MEESDKIKKLRILYNINTLYIGVTLVDHRNSYRFAEYSTFDIKYPLTFYSDIDH